MCVVRVCVCMCVRLHDCWFQKIFLIYLNINTKEKPKLFEIHVLQGFRVTIITASM